MPDLDDPTNGDGEAPAPPPSEAEIADDFDKPRALETIRKQREEAKALKAQLKELDALKAEKAQRDEAELNAAQKAEKKAADLEAKYAQAQAQLKRATLKDAINDAAAKKGLTFAQGALSDALALGLFDALEWDEDKPKGVTQALNDLVQARPYYFAAPAQPPDIGALERGKPKSTQDEDRLRKSFRSWGLRE